MTEPVQPNAANSNPGDSNPGGSTHEAAEPSGASNPAAAVSIEEFLPPEPADQLPPPSASQQPADTPSHIVPPRVPTSLSPTWLIAGIAAAVAADFALRRVPWNNVAGAVLILVLALGLIASGFIKTNSAKVMCASAVFFGVFLAVRTEPLSTAFNILAACTLLVLAAIHGSGRSFWNLRPLRVVADAGVLIFEGTNGLIEVPAELGARYRVAKEQAAARDASTAYAVVRGLAIALPVVVVLGLLLASADAVFQSFFTGFGGPNIGEIIGHIALLAIGAYAMLVLLRMAKTEGASDPAMRAPSLGHIETLVILISVNLLFGAFAIAQLMTVLGGAQDALNRAGLDPKQFARQGFFQLLWVAGLTLALLMTLHTVTAGNDKARSVNRFLSLLTVALTLLIVVVAFTRIGFYIEDGGQTALRLYSAIFCVWVGLAFIAMAVRIWGVKAETAWLFPLLLVSGLITLGAINVANPERIIALDNLNRDHDALYWHVVAGQFSGDGQAVLAEEMDRLSPELADRVTGELCQQYVGAGPSSGNRSGYTYKPGLLDFNLGKWRAENTVPDLCAQ